MFFIEVQQVDYDDYPVGMPTRIGPFGTEEETEEYMESSKLFKRLLLTPNYTYWVPNWGHAGKCTVNIRKLGNDLMSPDRFTELYSKHAKF